MINCFDKQAEFIESEAPYAAFIGGVGSGKSYALALWAIKQALRYPHVTGFLGANTYDQLHKCVLKEVLSILTERDIKFTFNRKPPASWPKPNKKVLPSYNKVLTLQNGAGIYCFSMENYEAIRGISVGWIGLDESRDMHEDAFLNIQTRKRGFGEFNYQIKTSTTPWGFNWVYYKFIDKDSEIYLPGTHVIHASTKDNIFNHATFYEGLKAGMSKDDIAQELEAQFIEKGKGAVYSFSRARHISKEEPGTEDNIIVSIDFNVAPLCATMAFIRNEALYFYDEVYIPNNGQVKDLCVETLNRLDKMKHTGVVEIEADIAGQNRTVVSLRTAFDLIREYLCEPLGDRAYSWLGAHRERSVYVGVQQINALLDRDKPKMFFNLRCKNTIRDMERLLWIPGTDQIDKSNKLLTHMADDVRYTGTRKFDELIHGDTLEAFWG